MSDTHEGSNEAWISSDNERIARVASDLRSDNALANATLMACAPDMLKFLKLLSEHLDHDPSEKVQTILDGALNVIARAEGK